MTNTLIFFAGILLAIVIGSRWHWNIGLVALAMAFLVGGFAGDLSAGAVVGLFPVSLFFNFFLTTFLFGFAAENGTLSSVAQFLLYYFRGARWAIGLLFFVITVIVAALGAGGAAPFFMSAICFSLAYQAGIHPLLVPMALWTGSMVGGSVPWSSGYATNCGQLEIYFEAEQASHYVYGFFSWRAIFYTILFLVLFVILRAYKVKSGELMIERPSDLTPAQKRTLIIILAVIALVLGAAILPQIVPVAAVKVICGKITFQLLATLGILTNTAWNTADYKKVMTTRVPWDTLIMLSTMGIYMSLANSLGVVAYMSDLLQNVVPASWILPGIILIMGVMSFFVSGGVVMPMMLPLMPALAAGSGVSAAAIYATVQMGLTASSISPFSQGGAAVLTGCQDEHVRNQLMRQQVIASGVITGILVVIAALGGFNMLQ